MRKMELTQTRDLYSTGRFKSASIFEASAIGQEYVT